MLINKDTQMCISLAKQAGNFGCTIHNAAFNYLGLNFIYKSFSTDDLSNAISGIRSLGIRGAGITMPHKIDVLNYIDIISEEVSQIGSSNTIVNNDGVLTAYNTDAFSAYTVLSKYSDFNKIFILGNGGFAKAVRFSATGLFDNVNTITRKNWSDLNEIKDAVVFNCTPVENIKVDKSNAFIDCIITTDTGMNLSLLQASKQFKLYTGSEFPMEHISKNFNTLMNKNS